MLNVSRACLELLLSCIHLIKVCSIIRQRTLSLTAALKIKRLSFMATKIIVLLMGEVGQKD